MAKMLIASIILLWQITSSKKSLQPFLAAFGTLKTTSWQGLAASKPTSGTIWHTTLSTKTTIYRGAHHPNPCNHQKINKNKKPPLFFHSLLNQSIPKNLPFPIKPHPLLKTEDEWQPIHLPKLSYFFKKIVRV